MTKRAASRAPGASRKSSGGDRLEIRDWMTTGVKTVKPQDTVAHARHVLEEHRINQLPVTMRGMLVGIVTDRDLRDATEAMALSAGDSRAEASPRAFRPNNIAIESVMTSNALVLAPGDTMRRAAEMMRRERVGAIPIVERGRLVGIITRSDILDVFMHLVG